MHGINCHEYSLRVHARGSKQLHANDHCLQRCEACLTICLLQHFTELMPSERAVRFCVSVNNAKTKVTRTVLLT